MTRAVAKPSEPSTPRRRRRLLWIILATVVGTTAAYEFLLESHVVLDAQGYLPATQSYGYGYDLRSLVRLHVLWSTYQSRSVVLWRAEKRPTFGEYHEINGHELNGCRSRKRNEKVVYSLQSDYTLKEILLSPQEADRMFALVEEAIKNNSFRPDPLWQTRIEPELTFVSSQQRTEAAATSPASVPSSTE